MLGTGLQFGRVRSEDLVFIPVKARKSQNQKSKQQQKAKEKDNLHHRNKESASSEKSVVPNDTILAATAEPPSRILASNLKRFLESTTPSVPAQYFSKTTMRGLRTCDVEFQPYFSLGDLWESFKEWSAYGAGVPLVLNGSNHVIQYYVPYLSGIQLYGESTASSSPKSRQAGEDSDGYYYRDSSSDGSSDYEFEKGLKFPRGLLGHYHPESDITFKLESFSISDEHSTTQEGFSSDEGEAWNSRGHLVFEYFEQDAPYSREPLADKILDLARHYPGLNTLKSSDLLPVSWICVAWYPIYRIPTGTTLKDLDACFLTYHSLATPMGGNGNTQPQIAITPNETDGTATISLPVFGMGSYKFKGSMWTQNGMSELQLASSLTKAADNWLRLLQVNHPDFQFFASHGMYQW